jgi:hypothetical protein
MLPDIDRAKIVITNYHAFKRRERMEVSKVGRALLQGCGPKASPPRSRSATRRTSRSSPSSTPTTRSAPPTT